MRIASKTTLTFLAAYLVLIVGLGLWLNQQLRNTVQNVMQDTARLVGNQVTLALRTDIVKALRQQGSGEAELQKSVAAGVERSDIMSSIDVVDKHGQVVASGDKTRIGQTWQVPDEVFPDKPDIRLIGAFGGRFDRGTYSVYVPVLDEGSLLGYVHIALDDEPITEIYDQGYAVLALTALCGMIVLVGFGLLLQYQLNRLGSGLAELITSAAQNPMSLAEITGKDEFSPVRQAAGQLGMALFEARGKADLAIRDLDTLAKVVRIGVLLLDASHKPAFVSEVARELVAGSNLDEVDARLQTIRAELEPCIEHMQSESRMVDTLDREIPDEAGTVKLRLEIHALNAPDWRGCLVLIKDRNMIDALEADLQEASRSRGLSRLYEGAVHDLRAPLNAMTMNLELLGTTVRDEAHPDRSVCERQTRYIDVVGQEMKRLSRLLNVLLEQTAPSEKEQTTVDVRELLDGLGILLAPQAKQQHVDLDIQLPPAAVTVPGEPGRLKQALMNIMLNGFEAMTEGGTLSIDVECTEEHVDISICDTGHGIPEALRNKIFDMHFTTRGTGTGIGLYVTRAVIERFGGTIRLDSELGEGSCFHVVLPRHKPETAATAVF